MGRFKFWMLIGGIALAWYGYKELRLSGEAKAEPQTITCEALGRDGYGDNAHVKMTDFLLSSAGYVYEEKKGGGWETVWIPVVPLNGPYAEMLRGLPEDAEAPAPKTFHVILQTSHASNAKRLGVIAGEDDVRGVVINEIDSLDSETRKLLRQSYPGIDLEKCWIVEHKRKTKGAGISLLLLVLGLGLAGGAGFLFWKALQRK